VIGRPIFKAEEEQSISMAFLCSAQNKKKKNNFDSNRDKTISLSLQAILALILPLVFHLIILVYKKLNQ